MGFKKFADSRVAMAVAATAAVCSPKTRAMLRQGAVYGLAGALRAGDALSAFARGLARGAQQAAAAAPRAIRTGSRRAETSAQGRGRPDGPASAKRASKRRSSRKKAPAQARTETAQGTSNE